MPLYKNEFIDHNLVTSISKMATWCLIQTSSFRVKPDGKGLQERKIDLTNPTKSLEELETKCGLTCPEERKRELLNKLQPPVTTNTVPDWLQNIPIPEWYKDAPSSEVTNALQWGCEMVQDQKRVAEHKLHDQLDLKWKKILDETQEDMKKELDRKEKEAQYWQHTAIQNLSASGVEAKIQVMRQEWVEEQRTMLHMLERERQTLIQQVDSLQSKVNTIEESREILRTKLDQRNNQDAMMNKSVVKGDAGEEMVDTWLRTAFYGATIEDTSKDTGKMDRHMYWEGLKIVIDSKRHDGKLHSLQDVKKFHDNFEQMPDAQIAILLCTHTVVPNHNRFWVETKIMNDNQLAVYMNNTSTNPIERLQLLAGTIIQPWKEFQQLRQQTSLIIAGDELKAWTDKARSILLNGWNLILRLQDQWTKTHTTITNATRDFQDSLLQTTQEMQTDLQSLSLDVSIPKKSKGKKLTNPS